MSSFFRKLRRGGRTDNENNPDQANGEPGAFAAFVPGNLTEEQQLERAMRESRNATSTSSQPLENEYEIDPKFKPKHAGDLLQRLAESSASFDMDTPTNDPDTQTPSYLLSQGHSSIPKTNKSPPKTSPGTAKHYKMKNKSPRRKSPSPRGQNENPNDPVTTPPTTPPHNNPIESTSFDNDTVNDNQNRNHHNIPLYNPPLEQSDTSAESSLEASTILPPRQETIPKSSDNLHKTPSPLMPKIQKSNRASLLLNTDSTLQTPSLEQIQKNITPLNQSDSDSTKRKLQTLSPSNSLPHRSVESLANSDFTNASSSLTSSGGSHSELTTSSGSDSSEEDESDFSDTADYDAFEAASYPSSRFRDGGYDNVALYDVLDLEALLREQKKTITQIAEILHIPPSSAAVLLRHFSWNTEGLLNSFQTDSETLCNSLGISRSTSMINAKPTETIDCMICFDSLPGNEMHALECEHFFCTECWQGFLHSEVNKGPSALLAKCPYPKCNSLVSETLFEKFCDPQHLQKYRYYLVQSFVDDTELVKWCPFPRCGRAVKATLKSLNNIACLCGNSWCFACHRPEHRPASCIQLDHWQKKQQSGENTDSWMKINTRSCPKCQRTIEKNGGCNHMACVFCKHEFCWICLGPWTDHGVGTGGFYSCNIYDPKKDHDLQAREKAKQQLERYLHFLRRYEAHAASEEFDKTHREVIKQRLGELENHSESYIPEEFIYSAAEQLKKCRNTLRYSYIVGFYISKHASASAMLFQQAQARLEAFTEQLANILESEGSALARSIVIDATGLAKYHLEHFLAGFTEFGEVLSDDEDDIDLNIIGVDHIPRKPPKSVSIGATSTSSIFGQGTGSSTQKYGPGIGSSNNTASSSDNTTINPSDGGGGNSSSTSPMLTTGKSKKSLFSRLTKSSSTN